MTLLVFDGQRSTDAGQTLPHHICTETTLQAIPILLLVAADQSADLTHVLPVSLDQMRAWSDPLDLIVGTIKALQAGRKR